jgi:hypothetical protein
MAMKPSLCPDFKTRIGQIVRIGADPHDLPDPRLSVPGKVLGNPDR